MEKINLVELLKDCPQGMKLDCSIFENLEFDRIDKNNETYPIICRAKTSFGSYNYHTFTAYGCYSTANYSKCTIFPENKTTWEGFVSPCKFKDGDIVTDDSGAIFIYSKIHTRYEEQYADFYCGITSKFRHFVIKTSEDQYWGKMSSVRLATEDEKQKLFQAIKDNGYSWNAETKTLEKLVESAEDTNDKIVMAGIYFDRNYYADEVELHLNNYEIEVRDGKTYAIFKNQKPQFKDGDVISNGYSVAIFYKLGTPNHCVSPDVVYYHCYYKEKYCKFKAKLDFGIGTSTEFRYATEEEKQKLFQAIKDNGYRWNAETKTLEKLIEPYFKIGDKIKHKTYISRGAVVTEIKDTHYILDGESALPFTFQDEYELVPNKFDITTLKTFDKVLVRCSDSGYWQPQFFSKFRSKSEFPFVCTYNSWRQCIPYKGNEHLSDTTNDCDEFYKTW